MGWCGAEDSGHDHECAGSAALNLPSGSSASAAHGTAFEPADIFMVDGKPAFINESGQTICGSFMDSASKNGMALAQFPEFGHPLESTSIVFTDIGKDTDIDKGVAKPKRQTKHKRKGKQRKGRRHNRDIEKLSDTEIEKGTAKQENAKLNVTEIEKGLGMTSVKNKGKRKKDAHHGTGGDSRNPKEKADKVRCAQLWSERSDDENESLKEAADNRGNWQGVPRKAPKAQRIVVRPLVHFLRKRAEGVSAKEAHEQWRQMGADQKHQFSTRTAEARGVRHLSS